MGEVYRATDTKLGRQVAIKVLPPEVAGDADRLARFEREARLLGSLNHPHIAAIYGLEEVDGTPFLALELVEGEDLKERLARGAIPVDEALEIARQIAEALEEAHHEGIVHRDLKPANVKLSTSGRVKVLDFGLAKALTADPASAPDADLSQSPTLAHTGTQQGVVLGTAAYMSPEQARGKPVDRRADTWALGCVLYEMLAGERAFGGATVTDVLAAVVRAEPDWLRLPADTPPAVRELLQRCLRKDARQRLQAIGDARIVLEEVQTAPGARDSVSTPVGATARQPARSWAAVLAAGAFVAGLGVAAWALWRPPPVAMQFRAVTNFAGVQAQPALSPDGRSVAFVSNRDGDFNVYVGLVSGGQLVQVTEGPNAKSRPMWSPDGTRIAYARLSHSGTFDVWVIGAFGGTPRRLLVNATDPAWSPDGQSLAYAHLATGTIWLSDPLGQNARRLTPDQPLGGPVGYGLQDTEPRFSPDGRHLAYVTRSAGPYGELKVIDLDSGQVRELTRDGALAHSPAWSPDGEQVYFASSRSGTMNVWMIAAGGGEPEQITAGQGDDVQPDVSSDGRRIVFSTFNETIGFAQVDLGADAASRQARSLAIDPARSVFAPVFSPDGTRLAYFSNFKGVENEGIWVAGADGSDPVALALDGRVNVFPRWTPDSRHLIYRSGPAVPSSAAEYRRVSILGGAPETILEGVTDILLDVGRDGRLLFRDPGGEVQAYDPSSHERQTLPLSPPSEKGWLLRWSPDGHSVAYLVRPREEGDPDQGLWVDDLGSPARQLFRGWVGWYVRGAGGKIYFLEGRPDLNGVVWKVGWDGEGLTRLSTLRHFYNYWDPLDATRALQGFFDVSPDGRYLAFDSQEVLQANIGMLERAE